MERTLTYAAAIHEALEQEMGRDDSIVLMGIGVTDHKGIYGTTLGLQAKFPGRVIETPLSEDAMTGVAIGMAMAGLHPVHVHARMDFMLLAMNQIVNMAAKLPYMQNGAVSIPLVVRGIIGRGWGQGAQHSQALHALFAHVPGLMVLAPATPYDAKGCMIQALRMRSPVIIVEHRMLYGIEGPVPEKAYPLPSLTYVLEEGKDITIVGISCAALQCLRAHELLKIAGIEAEIINLVGLRPLDIVPILESLNKTGCLLVVDVGWKSCGLSAEVLARVCTAGGAGRFGRLGFAAVPCPTAKTLEKEFYPSTSAIAARAYGLVWEGTKAWIPPDIEDAEITQFRGPF